MCKDKIDLIKLAIRQRSLSNIFYENLIELLREILDSPNLSGLCHPLGFYIITLQDWNDGERLRLHFWPDNNRKYNSDRNWVHNHEYDIDSLVLMGNIINIKYSINYKDKDNKYPIYNVVHDKNNSDLINTGKFCHLNYLGEERISKGEIYNINKSEFHASDTNIDKVVCTLVLNYNKHYQSPTILGEKYEIKDIFKYKREECDVISLKKMLAELILNLEIMIFSDKNSH